MRAPVVAVYLGWIAFVTCQLATAQEPQWWTNQKKACGLSSSLDYNSWVKSGSPCSAGTATPAVAAPTPQQRMGLALGAAAMPYVQQAVHDLFYGTPTVKPQLDPAQQQRELDAQQLNNSGVYLVKQRDYAGAINEFQKALALTPGDQNVQRNLTLAKQQLEGAAEAAQTSSALGQFLGNVPASAWHFDFDQLTHSSGANPNASALNLVNLDAGVVDLRGATTTSPASLKTELDGILANKVSASAPSASPVVLPQDKDMELLFQAASPAPPSSNVVLPQDKDMELLFAASPPSPPVNKPSDRSTAESLVELDKILDTKANQDFQSQLDWFNKVYLPAHPELHNPQPIGSGVQPHK